METTLAKTIDGLTVTVKITKKVADKTAHADGWNVDLGKEIYKNTTIAIEKGGKKLFCDDLNFFNVVDDRFDSTRKHHPEVYARFGNSYVGEAVYNIIKAVLTEAEAACQETAEFAGVKNAEITKTEAEKKEAAEIDLAARERDNHPGWCNKCQSYCYGDCEATAD